MESNEKVNQTTGALSNRRLALRLLRDQGALSRRQLAEQSGLRSSTVTYVTRDLLERGVIRTGGKVSRSGAGKKQVLLEINPDMGWVVGVGVEGDMASLVFLDAKGDVIDRDRCPLREPFHAMAQTLRLRVDNWLARSGVPRDRLLGVGAGIPGVVDPGEGRVLRSTRFGMEDWLFAAELAQAFEVPAVIDNDSNYAALAEARFGSASQTDSFLYFLINAREQGDRYAVHGLGSALYLGGEVFRGTHFGAGEIDTLIDREPYDTVTAEQLLAISDPEGAFTDAMTPLAERIVNTLLPIVDLIDPAVVILGGNLCLNNRRMAEHIQQQLNARIVPVPNRSVCVWPSILMDHGVSMGAGIAALDAVLPECVGHQSAPAPADALKQG